MQQNTYCSKKSEDLKELDLTIVETARFGKSYDSDAAPFRRTNFKKLINDKHKTIKVRPKVSTYKPKQKKNLGRDRVSHTSRDYIVPHKPIQLNLRLDRFFNDESSKKQTGEKSSGAKNSYRSRNYENLNSEKSTNSKVTWISQSMVSFKPKSEKRNKFRTAANFSKP